MGRSHATMQPRALLIDAMGTLVRLEDPAPRLAAGLRARFGVTISTAEARVALAAEIRFYSERFDEGVDGPAVDALRERCAAELWAALPPVDGLADVAPEDRVSTLLGALRFLAHADAAPALRRARAAGMRVIVVSNWDASLPDALDQTGLAGLVDGVVTSATVGARKPDRRIFARALELAGVAASAARHVGDSLEADVAGARAAGVDAVWLRREGEGRAGAAEPPPGVTTVASLDALRFPVSSQR